MKNFLKSKPEDKKDIESVNPENAQSEQIENLKQDIINQSETVAALTEEKTNLEASLSSLNEELATIKGEKESLTASLKESKAETEKEKKSSHEKAIQMLSEAGHPPVSAESEGSTSSNSDPYKEYRNLQAKNPEAAAKFWNENKSQILNK